MNKNEMIKLVNSAIKAPNLEGLVDSLWNGEVSFDEIVAKVNDEGLVRRAEKLVSDLQLTEIPFPEDKDFRIIYAHPNYKDLRTFLLTIEDDPDELDLPERLPDNELNEDENEVAGMSADDDELEKDLKARIQKRLDSGEFEHKYSVNDIVRLKDGRKGVITHRDRRSDGVNVYSIGTVNDRSVFAVIPEQEIESLI